ncbi:hypothetical protein [Evansella cellulosilytica]|uniref:Uncharacterized protein n=1 Tax=Evansella cellulosilytica (strain ATCC 21833 / DSM 2522 / FERM P-1141 / JCM 9156 / N-4) TaxID=649639 RepID=E6U1I2_EVAC2|nr:hypothetical protein [Evansella cellulosilytica]ADU30345.1 hypothetical protein Bcell_2084 [Evansella cellulosilytica DSM 2522]
MEEYLITYHFENGKTIGEFVSDEDKERVMYGVPDSGWREFEYEGVLYKVNLDQVAYVSVSVKPVRRKATATSIRKSDLGL